MCVHSERAADANNTTSALLCALTDQPRILANCAEHADLGFLAEMVARNAVSARALADELEAAALAMAGRNNNQLREAA